jgi:allantoicase
MTPVIETAAAFAGLIDLAAERLGGKVLLASDDFFAEKENLIKPGRGVFIPDKYTDRGKWMDGWESRRKRVPGHDWCLLKLGAAGRIRGVDIDTNHFLGNHPPYASIEACNVEGDPSGEALLNAAWTEILPRSPLRPGSQNLFAVHSEMSTRAWTHLRLNIYPDGGVARLRVYGEVAPTWQTRPVSEPVDLASVLNGGQMVACSDMFFGAMTNLIMPGRGVNMGDGWESKRRRGPGHDWAVCRLAVPGCLTQVVVDTAHFKGNYPDRFSLDGCHWPETELDSLNAHTAPWTPILPETKLEADTVHLFDQGFLSKGPFTHVRLNIYPDGGVSRLRLFGFPEEQAP